MKYMIAVLCPPWALVRVGHPFRAVVATVLIVGAALTWSMGVGVLLLAIVMSWSCRVVAEHEAHNEVQRFLRLFHGREVTELSGYKNSDVSRNPRP